MNFNKEFQNKNIVITGSNGLLGKQFVNAFLKLGSNVYGIDLSNSIKNKRFKYFKCDITDRNEIKEIEKKLKFKKIYSLINSAAIDVTPSSPAKFTKKFENFDDSVWDKMLDVNLSGTYNICKYLGRLMVKTKYGSIINISSIYGINSPIQSIFSHIKTPNGKYFKPISYSASKGGIINLTRYLAVYWAKKNIRVNNVIFSGMANNQDKSFQKKYCEIIPIGRMARKNEFNGTIIFLSSKLSSYITGSNIVCDGGWTAI